MNPWEILRFAVRGLTSNKPRSALTMLGVLIGVAAVIVLVAVGNGSSQQIKNSISRLGANSLTVTPSTSAGRRGGGMGGPGGGFGGFGGAAGGQSNGPRTQAHDLTVDDAKALVDPVNAPAVNSASPVVTSSSVTTTYAGTSHAISQFVGTYPAYFAAADKVVDRGTGFTNDDVTGGRKVVVIGTTVAEDLFGTVDPLNKQINVGGALFTVVGVLRESGSSGMQDADDVAIAPLPVVQSNLTGFGGLSDIVVEAQSAKVTDEAQSEVTDILDQRHGISGSDTADFQIQSQASLRSAVSDSGKTFTVLLGAVAAISLLVGGIGITNIMLVTVTERTREIGVRKAIGAPRGAILGQFVAEATVLSLLGGLSVVAIGVVASLFPIAGVRPVLVPSSIVLALAVSVAIGLFFGGYPAGRAARLRPIEALRHQ
ncbi:ABC transporter permease [Actinoallomurus iriomotensis]|uniref:Peptide ABC transporter permease n=1 Tax=Actinoallomurus iriomotensis TaxID=478107 RepID=A0A9W6RXK7_9ACTN|nr:ABC transporter permease [Actinoallomurus iriomotensis]GLY81962.1 peptide ABC transporter permease [Actinoallomurus iriomotensis]